MVLTKDDLGAIQTIVYENAVLIRREINELSLDTAAGFVEVHSKLATIQSDLDEVKVDLGDVKTTVKIIQRVQAAEIERVDKHESAIQKMRKALQAV